MPHLVLEHSSNLPGAQILKTLHETLAAQETINPHAIKSRSMAFDSHLVGGEAGRAFCCLTVSVMAGRAPALREKIIDALNEVLRKWAPHAAVSVHLMELKKEDYRTFNP